MAYSSATREQRVTSGAGALIVTALLGYALVVGLGVTMTAVTRAPLELFDLAPAPPPDPVRIVPVPANNRPSGEAAPPDLRSKSTQVVAPVPVVVVPLPQPVVSAPVIGVGSRSDAGAAPVAGPGTGAGGIGDGLGGGGDGDGDGSGYGETPPRRVSGRLSDSDFPQELAEPGVSGVVGVRYTVRADGRVSDCIVERSSGNGLLDRTTCALIEKRFRYRPSRDRRGRPVVSQIVENHSWMIE